MAIAFDPLWLNSRWRQGRSLGRTVYVQLGTEPSDTDPLIGMFDAPWLAAHVVEAHNYILEVELC